MRFSVLNPKELEAVKACLQSSFDIWDFDFETRLGVSQQEMNNIIAEWPNEREFTALAARNVLNDLLYGEGLSDEKLIRICGLNRLELSNVFQNCLP